MRAVVLLGLGFLLLALPAGAGAGASRPAAGARLAARPAHAAETAVVRFAELARADAARRAFTGALTPLAILQGDEPAEGGSEAEEPGTGTPHESYAFPVPGLAPLVPSPAPAQSFAGLGDIPREGTNTITIPPDVDGAVGPARILEDLNNNYRLFDKSTGGILGTVSINTFWAAAGAGPTFDPKLLYDPVQQRWIAVALSDARSNASSILLGVSQTSDPGGAWNLFRVLGDSSGVLWADFPCVGFNAKWIAVNVNQFTVSNNTGTTSRCLIVDYAQARGSTLVASFADGTGFCSAPVATASATEPTLYVPTHLSSASGTYRVDTITGTPASPVYTVGATRARGVTWTQPLGSILPQAPPLSGSSICGVPVCMLETQDAQIRSTPVCRDGSIWYAQTIGLPPGGLTHTAVQWTRLEAATGNVLDGGRIDEPTATGSNGGTWYAYPHVAVNGAGDALVCFSQFSSAQYPSAGYAMRFSADAAGTLREPVLLAPGEDYYHKDFGSGRNRWGDYAKAQVDPSDDASLWLVAQYAVVRTGTDDGSTGSNSSKWGTWWARIGPVLTIGPGPSVPEGDSGLSAITVPVILSQPLPTDVTVHYVVSDGTARVTDSDYDSPDTAVVIPAGALGAAIPLNIHGDLRCEGGNETFTVALVSAPGVTLGSPAQATVTITDDDECTPPKVTVLSPNGGETLTNATTARLTWLATDSVGVTRVDLALSRNGGATFTPIATGVANDGHFDWDVTPPATAQALLRVTAFDAKGNAGSDVSDARWSIAFPSTAVPEEPVAFALGSIVPNPVVARARIDYALPRAGHVRLAVADLQGRTLAVLVDGMQPAGRHSVTWSTTSPGGPRAVAAGVYFVRYEADGRFATRRFAVTR